ncbi:hypothetical protein ACWERW_36240 [Streptomyces sp. NPDC004012]
MFINSMSLCGSTSPEYGHVREAAACHLAGTVRIAVVRLPGKQRQTTATS